MFPCLSPRYIIFPIIEIKIILILILYTVSVNCILNHNTGLTDAWVIGCAEMSIMKFIIDQFYEPSYICNIEPMSVVVTMQLA